VPRDVGGDQLIRALTRFGYEREHQAGSHLKMATTEGGRNIAMVPVHSKAIPMPTLAAILKGVAQHHAISVEELIKRLGL
jgi:predicted RNA binding protein YcfA (HicA-like mRNA interferase family)